jgi:hypothetical protein
MESYDKSHMSHGYCPECYKTASKIAVEEAREFYRNRR